jgi:uncharacterized protein with GYD domain
MAKFFMFGKYSAESLKNASAKRTKKVRALVKKAGGKIESMYAFLGDRDLVIICEFPGVDEAVKASIELNMMTGISFSTVQVMAVEDFDKILDK